MGIRNRVEYVLKHYPRVMNAFVTLGSLLFKAAGCFVRTNDELVLFCSYSGKAYNDSPRRIYEQMLSDPRCAGLRYVWALREPDQCDIPGNCEKVRMDSPAYFVAALRAKAWVANVNIERGLRFKKKNQFYLNTWHAMSVNWVGNAVAGRNDFCWDYVDAFCYSGEYEREFIKRDFCIRDEHLLASGLPRNDDLYAVDEVRRTQMREKLGIPKDKRVILYAPTWRESTDNGKSCNIAPPIDIEKWRVTLAQDYVLIFRTHHNTREILGVSYDDFVRDGSNYPEVNDLMVVADYLISDYSGIIMDYSILSRPIIEFGYDYDEYVKTRGFYFDLDKEIPSGILRTQEEVFHYILTCDYEAECAKVRDFRDRHHDYGGQASKMCVDAVIAGIQMKE